MKTNNIHQRRIEEEIEMDEVEGWQVLSIRRLDPSEPRRWGVDGSLVVEWFDRGELAHAAEAAGERVEARDGRLRFWDWLRDLCGVGTRELQTAAR